MQTLQDMLTVEDFDVSDAFQHSRSTESVKSAASETYMSTTLSALFLEQESCNNCQSKIKADDTHWLAHFLHFTKPRQTHSEEHVGGTVGLTDPCSSSGCH